VDRAAGGRGLLRMPAAQTDNSTGSAARDFAAIPETVGDPIKRFYFKGPLDPRKTHNEFTELTDYAERILSGEVLVHRVRLDVARICNYRCPFCFSNLGGDLPSKLAEQCMPLEIIRELLPEFGRLGVRIVNLYGGGEPTLHPQFSEILRLLANADIRMRIITNGSGLNSACREAIVACRSHIDVVRVSFPGVSAASFQRMTGTMLFETVAASVRELAQMCKRCGDPIEIGLYVPVTEDFAEDEVSGFVDYASASGADWLFFREDIRFPSSADQPLSIQRGFHAVQERVSRMASACTDFPIYYAAPSTAPNQARTCYFQLTDAILCFDPPTRRLLLVRCEHYIPGGLSDLPMPGAYRLIEPGSLYAECGLQIRELLCSGVQRCPRPDFCMSAGRNERIQDQLAGEERSRVILAKGVL
jgi:uncharacterized Fe-S cluster-containing radical SAM superfamily protein